jgi:outer membrane usher protein FimD/PapC
VTSPGVGNLRVAVNLLYGLTETVTLSGGLATYSPDGADERRLVTAGIRTSIRGVATQLDVARDDQHGTAAAMALAGRLMDLSIVLRHAEYRGGFVDETLSRGGSRRPLTRATEADFDWQLQWGQFVLPLSMRVSRDQYRNGDIEWNGLFRTSTALGGIYVSSGLDYSRMESVAGSVTNRLTGVLSASSFALFKWQLRASLDYTVLPEARLRAFAITADRDLSENMAVRLGVGRSFTGDKDTNFQLLATRRFPFADLSLQGEYSTPRNDWHVGLQLAFSLVPQPFGGGYALARPGAAAGGNLALQAFVDRNANARFDRGEEPVPGVVVSGLSNEKIVTDEKGRALVTGLGYGSIAQVRTNIDDVALGNISGPPSVIEFTPRAGAVAIVAYPLETEGEIMLKVSVQRGEKKVGLSAVMVQAVGENGQIREGITEFDGSILFDGLRPGNYRLELAEQQAKRLKMRLAAPVSFTISGDGGAAPDVEATVVFDNAQ